MKVEVDFKNVNKLLDNLKKELNRGKNGARAGFLKDDTRDDGLTEETVALANEFGADIHIPEHKSTIYRKVDKNGNLGKFTKENNANFAQDVTIPAHDVHIPARPFLRNAQKILDKRLPKVVQSCLDDERTLEYTLNQCAQEARNQIIESINSNTPPPNKPSTVRRKKSNKTLIDTGQLRSSVHCSVIIDNSERLRK